MSSPTPSLRPVTQREIFAWAMYDWANSAFSTMSIVVTVLYITLIVFAADSAAAISLAEASERIGWPVAAKDWGAVIWAWGLALAGLVAAILSPIVGAMADARATKRQWLAVTALSGAALSASMYFVPPHQAGLIVALFVASTLCFDLSFGISNGFLPELADETTINRVSSWGFALGYIGGGLALSIELMVLTFGERIGIVGDAAQLRFGLLLMGVWWGVFSIPAIWVLRDRGQPACAPVSIGKAARRAIRDVRRTIGNVRRYGMLALFLVAFLFFNEGIQTVINQASVFAEKAVGFEQEELVQLVLVFQFICFPGAMLVGRLADRIGQKQTLMLCLGVWVALVILAFFVTQKWQFWLMACGLGLVMGGTQSVARAVMGMMTPARHTAEFFGFFNFSGKATSWLGSGLFGLIVAQTGDARKAVLGLLPLFLIGWGLTALVNVARGRSDALAANSVAPAVAKA
jgi:UMF1 family MFS transporter